MNVNDVMNRVRNIAGDQTGLQFDDSTLVDWINDGVSKCAEQNLLLQKRATSVTAVGTKEYDLPSDILKLHSVSVDNSKIQLSTLQEFHATHNETDETGQPSVGYVWVNKLNLYPIPSAVVNLSIDYIRSPTPVVFDEPGLYKTADIDLPVSYHSRIVDYCLAQVAQQDGDSNLYSVKIQEFNTGVQELKDKNEWEDDLYPFISVGNRDMGDGIYYD